MELLPRSRPSAAGAAKADTRDLPTSVYDFSDSMSIGPLISGVLNRCPLPPRQAELSGIRRNRRNAAPFLPGFGLRGIRDLPIFDYGCSRILLTERRVYTAGTPHLFIRKGGIYRNRSKPGGGSRRRVVKKLYAVPLLPRFGDISHSGRSLGRILFRISYS